ncbi:hypothetical protein H696_01950 [Fonticula alba]|uniref:SSD domain-containing protein n=1 Tax=Fonticula alba TaxID=691883 RepID=A0A058Z9V5_FONAL|nr:hypothetical protein H696_01950 [Fonticula alba]KCV71005.1 hypothetical protein H696_01950 [Fonticula alba]|eukprot:XP_009494128.1 hypothetical protein H696_01950 [Fonticula alba]
MRGAALTLLAALACLLTVFVAGVLAKPGYTEIHAPGYCAFYDECGQSVDPLNPGPFVCPDNRQAVPLDSNRAEFVAELEEFCGPDFSRDRIDSVCCSPAQLVTMKKSLSAAQTFVYNCPACWTNLKSFWCHQTCNPNQSLFWNVTDIQTDPSGSGLDVVMSGAYFVSADFGQKLYDSCAETKFGMSNSLAMDFIGGGADNYLDFLRYMGDPKAMGSPFKIFFPDTTEPYDPVMQPLDVSLYRCDDENPDFRCACMDCAKSCPIPVPLEETGVMCMVGSISCLSLSLIIIYGLFATAMVAYALLRKDSFGGRDDTVSEALYHQVESEVLESEKNRDTRAADWVLYDYMQRFFFKLGFRVARHPALTLLFGLLAIEVCLLGLIWFRIEVDPIELWVAPNAVSRTQKDYFDQNFGPFYRTQQFIVSMNQPEQHELITESTMRFLFEVEAGINNLHATVGDSFSARNVTLSDLCFKPLGEDCVVQSVTQYWQGDEAVFDKYLSNWEDHFKLCVTNPSFPGDAQHPPCLPSFQDPLKTQIVLGGYEDTDYMTAQAFVITYANLNSLDEHFLDMAYAWEKEFVRYMADVVAKPEYAHMRITYFTESGVEVELARGSTSDITTIAVSYLVMFLYVSLSLGSFSTMRRFVVDTKFTLGVAGVVICLSSFLAAVGIFSAIGYKTSLIIAEVIPFLVLAVGVDNVFILVNAFNRLDRSRPVSLRVAATLASVGPSITLSALSESVAFLLGVIVTMPAVNSFALYSAVSVFIGYLLQITVFMALLSADARRREARRVDCLPCIQLSPETLAGPEGLVDNKSLTAGTAGGGPDYLGHEEEQEGATNGMTSAEEAGMSIAHDGGPIGASSSASSPDQYERLAAPVVDPPGMLQRFVEQRVSPLLAIRWLRISIVLAFGALLVAGVSLIPHVELGLDQTIALPDDSYLIPYFHDQANLLMVGAPVYFVVQGGNATTTEGKAQLCGGFHGCDVYSVANILVEETTRSEESFITLNPASWIDDYLSWLNPINKRCCRVQRSDPSIFCQADEDPLSVRCRTCYNMEQFNNLDLGPEGKDFLHYLDLYMQAIPGVDCPRAGAAAYGDAIVPLPEVTSVEASHFRTYHTVLVTQADYIHAYRQALRVADRVAEEYPGQLTAYPYSIWHIYFEQYLTIVPVAFVVLGAASAAVFLVSWLILGQFLAAVFVLLPVLMIVANLAGVMAIWGITLNAVSLVNLVMALGIAVEFTAHTVRAYTTTPASIAHCRVSRAQYALNEVGASVFSGITVTKLLGVAILGFAQSQIFVVYYFRMYVAIVALGFLHGQIFLPALFCLVGPAPVAGGMTAATIVASGVGPGGARIDPTGSSMTDAAAGGAGGGYRWSSDGGPGHADYDDEDAHLWKPAKHHQHSGGSATAATVDGFMAAPVINDVDAGSSSAGGSVQQMSGTADDHQSDLHAHRLRMYGATE